MAAVQDDHWSAEAYQSVASFVPKLATKVVGWLDVQPDDQILDVGCGDGIINLDIAQTLSKGTGKIHGIDSSEDMIAAAQRAAKSANLSSICTFEVADATHGPRTTTSTSTVWDKVFSNAAMHWILRPAAHRASFFAGVHAVLKPGGTFVFEMGGMGNVAEVHTALLSVVGRRVGLARAREVDPWFFPDEIWMTRMLEETVGGFKVEKIEREFRPTKADSAGVKGWIRLMGKQFLDAVKAEERETCIEEMWELLETIVASPGGGDWFGYVRLRAIVRRI